MPVAMVLILFLGSFSTTMGIVSRDNVFEPHANMSTDQIFAEAGPGATCTFEGDYVVIHRPGDKHKYMYFQKFVGNKLDSPDHDANYYSRYNIWNDNMKDLSDGHGQHF